MTLKLQRPLIVLDLESTGVNPRYDRIIEFAAIKIHPDGQRETLTQRINPERPIPPAAFAVHGISDADVAPSPPFRDVAGTLLRFLRNCDLAGFGILQFDLPLLRHEFSQVGMELTSTDLHVIDAKVIFHQREPRTLSAALRFYCAQDHENAHEAMGDVIATLSVLEGQLERYSDLPHDVAALDHFCNPPDRDALDPEGKVRWSGKEAVITFGQKSGMSLRQLAEDEPGYLRWILNKEFNNEVKDLARNALAGRFPQREETT